MNIVTKATGDTLTATEFNQIPDELENVISSAGLSPDNDDLHQVAKSIAQYAVDGNFYTTSGSANAITLVNSQRENPSVLTNGLKVRFIALYNNTGATTLNVATLGAKDLKYQNNALSANTLIQGKFYEAIYNISLGYFELSETNNLTEIKVYDTVADLKADSSLRSGIICLTKGYYSDNDGGQAQYLIREKTPSDTDDGGSILDITGGSYVAELMYSKGIINIMQFGTKGDALAFRDSDRTWYTSSSYTTPASDDTTQIQNAITFARSKNLALFFPRTNGFRITAKLNLSNVPVYSNGSRICSNLADDFTMIEYTSGTPIMHNMTIHAGNITQTQAGNGDNIFITATTFGGHIQFENVSSFYAKRDGISIEKCGYTFLKRTQSNVSGRYNFNFTNCTSMGAEILSNSGQYGLYISNCANMKFTGVNEHNYGIYIAGANNRSLEFDSFYEEWIYPIAQTTYNNSIYDSASVWRNITLSNDTSSSIANISLTGLTKSNVGGSSGSDAYYNKLYLTVTNDGTDTSIKIYKDSGLSSSDLVASGSITGTSGVVTISSENDSGITGSITVNYTTDENLITATLAHNFVTLAGAGIGLNLFNCYSVGLIPAMQISSLYYRINVIGCSSQNTPKVIPQNWGICDSNSILQVTGVHSSKFTSDYGSEFENISFNSPAHTVKAMLLASVDKQIISFQEKQAHNNTYADRVYIKKVGNLVARSLGMYPTPRSLVGNGEIFIDSQDSNIFKYKDYNDGTFKVINLT